MNSELFKNRSDAGKMLAEKLINIADAPNPLILALPRGGVPVGYEIAKRINAPLDVFLVRKLGVPGQEELALGAIASGGMRVFNSHIIQYLNISAEEIDRIIDKETREIQRRERLYRGNRPALKIENRTVILVDDGLATGASMKAALLAMRQANPAEIIVAVPVAAKDTHEEFCKEGIPVICIATPEPFYGVGYWYEDFSQTEDEEVCHLLKKAAVEHALASTHRNFKDRGTNLHT